MDYIRDLGGKSIRSVFGGKESCSKKVSIKKHKSETNILEVVKIKEFFGLPLMVLYMVFAFSLLFISLFFVPKKYFKLYFYDSLLWGFIVSLLSESAFTYLGLLKYLYMGPFNVLGSPLLLNLAWSPTIMIFLYFLPPKNRKSKFWIYLLSFSLLSASMDTVFNGLGLLRYLFWSPVARFAVAFIWFYLTAKYHRPMPLEG
jgi:hypothetical protein